MIDFAYAEYSWEQAAALLAIDSPSGFTGKAAAWVQNAFRELGFPSIITNKGGVLIDLGGEDSRDGLSWKPTLTPWAAWSAASRETVGSS